MTRLRSDLPMVLLVAGSMILCALLAAVLTGSQVNSERLSNLRVVHGQHEDMLFDLRALCAAERLRCR